MIITSIRFKKDNSFIIELWVKRLKEAYESGDSKKVSITKKLMQYSLYDDEIKKVYKRLEEQILELKKEGGKC